MAETHRSHWSTFRMALSGALLLGALTVLGLVASPQSAAYAAATPNDGVESVEHAKQSKPAKCESSGPFADCNRLLQVGDTVRVVFTQDGASCIFWVLIVTHDPSIFNDVKETPSYEASGDITEINKKTALACELMEIGKGDKWYLSYEVVEKGNKGGK